MIGLLEDTIEVESIRNRTKLIKMLLKEVGVGETEQTRQGRSRKEKVYSSQETVYLHIKYIV